MQLGFATFTCPSLIKRVTSLTNTSDTSHRYWEHQKLGTNADCSVSWSLSKVFNFKLNYLSVCIWKIVHLQCKYGKLVTWQQIKIKWAQFGESEFLDSFPHLSASPTFLHLNASPTYQTVCSVHCHAGKLSTISEKVSVNLLCSTELTPPLPLHRQRSLFL